MRISIGDTRLYFDVEGASLSVEEGERPTILLLHGGPGFDHSILKPFFSPLAEIAQLVYLDQRGQGRSDRPALESCTPARMADDAAALCRALEIERPIVLGHSFGGFVALDMAIRHPDVVGGLVLLNTAAASADMDGGLEMLEAHHGPAARAAAERMFGGDFSIAATEQFGRLVGPTYVGDPAAGPLAQALFGRCAFNAEVARLYFQRYAPTYDLRPRLGEIAVPTLVIGGEEDWVTHPNASRALARGIAGAQLLVLPGTGHLGYVERPAPILDAIARFAGRAEPAALAGGAR